MSSSENQPSAQEQPKADTTHTAGIEQNNRNTEPLAENYDPVANNIVKNHIIASMALGLVPVAVFDLAALTATQMSMLRSLSEHFDVDFEDGDIKPLLMSLVGGSLPVLGVLGFSSVIKLIPGVGTLVGSASLSMTAGAVTYAVGQVFIMHFQAGGTLQDFEPRQAREFFKREVAAGRAFVQTMREELQELKQAKQAQAGTADTADNTADKDKHATPGT